MRLDAGRSRLYSALKDLLAKWDQIEPTWNDVMRQEFEAKVLEPLTQSSEEALRAMDALAQVLTTMRNDCEGRPSFFA